MSRWWARTLTLAPSRSAGLYVDLTSSLTNLKISNSAFDNLHYGWYLQKQVSADTSTVQYVDVENTTFNHNNLKGIYAEKLEDATFTGVTVSQNGYDGSLLGACRYFVPGWPAWTSTSRLGLIRTLPSRTSLDQQCAWAAPKKALG